MPLKQVQGAINGHAIDLRVLFAGMAKDLACIQVLLRCFDDTQYCPALVRHAQAAGHEFRLQASGSFGLGKWHAFVLLLSCNCTKRKDSSRASVCTLRFFMVTTVSEQANCANPNRAA